MKKCIIKRVKSYNPIENNNKTQVSEQKTQKVENKTINDVMDTKQKIELANQILGTEPKVKKIKKEKGLIERAESSITILTEDNRELLKD